MSWVEWLSPVLRVSPRGVRDALGVLFAVVVLVNPDTAVAFLQWLGGELAEARMERLMEATSI